MKFVQIAIGRVDMFRNLDEGPNVMVALGDDGTVWLLNEDTRGQWWDQLANRYLKDDGELGKLSDLRVAGSQGG